MERQPHSPEGGEHHYEHNEPLYEQLSDELRIQRGIADALHEGRAIDDETARRIAGPLHGGRQDSALYAFASSGALPDRLESELLESVQDLPVTRDNWIDTLLDYADARGEDRGPRERWGDVSRGDVGHFTLPPERSAQEMSATAPEQRFRDRQRFDQLTGAGQEPEAVEGTTSPERDPHPHPRIYVRCLAAYTNGILHGCWVEANQNVERLRDEIQTMLNASPVPEAEEYAIHDYEGFAGYPLGKYENLTTISRIAQGIAEHGHAFAAYAEWMGSDDPELKHFDDHFEGIYSSEEAWAEQVAEEVFEWPRHLATIPEPLRSAVTLNLADLALILAQTHHVVDGNDGVYVFNPDA